MRSTKSEDDVRSAPLAENAPLEIRVVDRSYDLPCEDEDFESPQRRKCHSLGTVLLSAASFDTLEMRTIGDRWSISSAMGANTYEEWEGQLTPILGERFAVVLDGEIIHEARINAAKTTPQVVLAYTGTEEGAEAIWGRLTGR